MLPTTSIHLRTLNRDDLADVLMIERASYAGPWSERDFDGILRSPRSFAVVAQRRGEVCGYLIGEQEGSRVQVLNLCVAPLARRRGVASGLLRRIARQVRARQRLVTIVAERNLPAQLFLRSRQFRAVAVLRHWPTPGGDDAYLFEYRPEATASARAPSPAGRGLG